MEKYSYKGSHLQIDIDKKSYRVTNLDLQTNGIYWQGAVTKGPITSEYQFNQMHDFFSENREETYAKIIDKMVKIKYLTMDHSEIDFSIGKCDAIKSNQIGHGTYINRVQLAAGSSEIDLEDIR